ncbi:MAG: hypothetical protein EP330_10005 [Deltaproteobacteria bacterium]|nr:MAG: hypothetical protein EP330_10005 [Deltaproteobacteria bacterium]
MRLLVPFLLLGLTACAGGDDDPTDDTVTDDTTDSGGDTGTADRLEAYGCTIDTATDLTGQAAVTITDEAAWSVGHNLCILVDVGTVVTWEGNFDSHPLEGGVDATEDTSSPIDQAGPGSGSTPIAVTFSAGGDFGYYCGIHTGSMNGVVYVGG